MTTKRIMRWVIVLFLLAALPVMTAVMAQEEMPAKQMPVEMEVGESAAPLTYNVYESENNNTFANADPIAFGDVMGGKINAPGDVDYFRFHLNAQYQNMLIDVEARSIGSSLNSVVCLYTGSEQPWGCNDDTDTQDSLLFAQYIRGSDMYVTIAAQGNNTGGQNYQYELILSSPLLISAAAAGLRDGGTVAGIHFYSEDILAWSELNTGDEKWLMFFDGSDVGITKNILNVADWQRQNGDNIAITLAANQNVPGIGTVTPYDLIRFDPIQYGPATAGVFFRDVRLNEHGLTTSSERIDGLDHSINNGYCLTSQMFPVSTVGTALVMNYQGTQLKFQDEDIFCYRDSEDDIGGWLGLFSGRLVPGLAAEDVFAMSYDNGNHAWYLTILGSGTIGGHTVTQKDIFAIQDNQWYPMFWHGPDHGWNYKIDAFEYMRGW